jgi:hypothetical protein
LEIDEYFSEKSGDCEIPINKQELSKQRSYLNPAIFKDTDKYALKDIYSLYDNF